MPHSAVYKAVYIHIPKNAGTSIESWMSIDKKKFHKQVNGIEVDHMTAEQYQSHWLTIFQSYFKFTIVRNPFDRMVSEFLHKKRYRDTRFIDATNLSFEEFIVALKDKFFLIPYKKHAEVSHFLPQHSYTHNRDGYQLVDYIGKFDNLTEEIKKLGSKLGINKPFLKVDQFSADTRLSCAKYYTQKSMEIVAKLYEKDFELFGYPTTIKLEPIKVVHLINPYFNPNEIEQESRTMKSLIKAKESTKRDKIELTACYLDKEYNELKPLLPNDFKKLFISKTVNSYLDLGLEASSGAASSGNANKGNATRPLPLINDILECLYEHTTKDTDVVVYSNMDINVTDDFYSRICERLRSGIGHFCLNRSTIAATPENLALDPMRDNLALKRLTVNGSPHPGYDCFVFYRAKLPMFKLGKTILGYTPIGEHLKNQLTETHWSFKVYEKDNLTYHFGNDTPHYQKTITNLVYTLFNFQQSRLMNEFQSHCVRIFDLALKEPNLDIVHHNICKLNLSLINQQNHQHCHGWNSIIDYLNTRLIHNDGGVHLIDFFDKDINRPAVTDVCYRAPWVGFFHMAPGRDLPNDSATLQGLIKQLEQKGILQTVLGHCQGIFVLTNYLKQYLESYLPTKGIKIDFPIEVLCHPKEIPMQFNLKDFVAKKKKKILHIGRYLRNIDSFSKLKVPPNYHKQLLNNSLNNRDYLNLLSSNIVFVDFYDASASNLIVECLVANVPIMVNPIPPVIEYLGENYPLYYRSLEEASNKLVNDHYIILAYHYLKNLNKEIYGLKFFYDRFVHSQILGNIKNTTFPTQNQSSRKMAITRPITNPSVKRFVLNAPTVMWQMHRARRVVPIMSPNIQLNNRVLNRAALNNRITNITYRTSLAQSTRQPGLTGFGFSSDYMRPMPLARRRPGMPIRRNQLIRQTGSSTNQLNTSMRANIASTRTSSNRDDDNDSSYSSSLSRPSRNMGNNRLVAHTLINMAIIPAISSKPTRKSGVFRRPKLPMLTYQ